MKEWEKPELQNLALESTKEGVQPYFWWPYSSECENPANTGPGFEECPLKCRPCKYYGIPAGGKRKECCAPIKTQGTIS